MTKHLFLTAAAATLLLVGTTQAMAQAAPTEIAATNTADLRPGGAAGEPAAQTGVAMVFATVLSQFATKPNATDATTGQQATQTVQR